MVFSGTKYRKVWLLALKVIENHSDMVDGLHFIEDELYPDHRIKIFSSEGYCFELHKEAHCDPDEIDEYDIHDLMPDGCTYDFCEPWDGFKEGGIDKCIEILENYGKLEIQDLESWDYE